MKRGGWVRGIRILRSILHHYQMDSSNSSSSFTSSLTISASNNLFSPQSLSQALTRAHSLLHFHNRIILTYLFQTLHSHSRPSHNLRTRKTPKLHLSHVSHAQTPQPSHRPRESQSIIRERTELYIPRLLEF